MKAMDNVRAARDKDRSTGISYIRGLTTDFTELHGDRRYSDDAAIVGGIASFHGRPVTVIAIEKGTETRERVRRNFGSAHPEGYRKAQRLMKQAEKFGRPVICFVDTSGAYCGIEAESRGQGQAVAESIYEMMALKVPVISILIGEGGSGGALALAAANEVWMLEKAVYSVISPEGCASILYKDAAHAEQAAEDLKLTSGELARLGIIERVIPEDDALHHLDAALRETLVKYENLTGETLAELRYDRFRRFGA